MVFTQKDGLTLQQAFDTVADALMDDYEKNIKAIRYDVLWGFKAKIVHMTYESRMERLENAFKSLESNHA